MTPTPKDGDTIAVWFSCGAASAVATRETIMRHGEMCNIRVINNPVVEEGWDNRRFLADVEKWLGITVEIATNPKFPDASAEQIWEKRKYMSGVSGAPCTSLLKKDARHHWEKTNHADWHVFGFTADEIRRHERFILTERPNVLPVLIDRNISKSDCFQILDHEGIELPVGYREGLISGNCRGCIKSKSPDYWRMIYSVWPEVFWSRANQSRRLGVKLVEVAGSRIYLDELDLTVQQKLDFSAPECGALCEEDRP